MSGAPALDLVRAAEAAGARLEARLWCDAPGRLAPALRDALAQARPAVLRLLLDGHLDQGKAAPLARTAEADTPPTPAPSIPDDDAGHRTTFARPAAAPLRRPPSWAPASALPSPGATCSCCAGQAWWCERERPSGWRCSTCYPHVHLSAEAARELRT